MKKIISIALTLLLIISLFGCRNTKNKSKNNEEAPEVVTYTEEEYLALKDELTQLENELAVYDGKYKTLKAFKKKNVVQSGVWSYNKIYDKIVLNNTNGFERTASIEPIGLISSIHLGDKLTLKADSWQVQTNTSELYLCIPNHAYGRISLYKYNSTDDDYYFADSIIVDYIKPYFESNNIVPKDNGRNIYVNEDFIGQELSGTISILDSTSNGMELTVPAVQLLEEDLLELYKLNQNSNVNVSLKLNDSKEISGTYRVGIGNAGGTVIYYEFLTLDQSGKIHADDLLSSVKLNNSQLYLR